MPDLELAGQDGPLRVYRLLHDGRPVLLNLGEPSAFDIGQRVRLVEARYEGAWELPVIGPVAAPAAVLVRPDGYVAWVGEAGDEGLADALNKWFGPSPRQTTS
jgi:hypothetical protein